MSDEEEIISSNFSELHSDNETIPLKFAPSFIVVTYFMYNSVFVACILGNFFVCYVVFSCNGMRTVTNYLIANLAIGDLLLAILCVPFGYITILYQYWPFGIFLCHLLSPAQGVCVFVSAYTLVVIAVDRYMAILYPLKPRLRRSQATIIICVVWVIACVQAAPLALFTSYREDRTQKGKYVCIEDWGASGELRLIYDLALVGLQYVFPVAVLIFTYVRIAFAIWGKRAPGEAEDGRDQRLAKAKRKMIKMMVTVVIVYTVSWLPFNILMVLLGLYGPALNETDSIHYIFLLTHWLAMAHTVWNPIIYCWMNSRFRKGFRTAAARIPCLRRYFSRTDLQGVEYRLKRMGTRTMNSSYPCNGHGRPLMRATSVNSNQTTFSKAHNSIQDEQEDPYSTTQTIVVRHGTKFGL